MILPKFGVYIVFVIFIVQLGGIRTRAHEGAVGKARQRAPADDSPRCRISHICDDWGQGGQGGCHTSAGNRLPGNGSLLLNDLLARERDEELRCVFTDEERSRRVKNAIAWSWMGYENCAAGEDELQPLTCSGQHWLNLTLTAVDALDTLLIAGLHGEFEAAMSIVEEHMHMETSRDCNVFETTIRILGGLLSTYFGLDGAPDVNDVEGKKLRLLNKAVELGSRLMLAFESPTGIPYSDVDLMTGSTAGSVARSSLSEMTTLALEFTILARLTNVTNFEDAPRKVYDVISDSVQKSEGILPQYFSPADASASGNYFMLGARTDSYYEYLLKQWILTGKADSLLRDRYIEAMKSVRTRLLRRTTPVPGSKYAEGLLYVGELNREKPSPKMDHLVCFLPGTLALGDFHGISTAVAERPGTNGDGDADNHLWGSDLFVAEELAKTCYELYRLSPSGLAPEIVHFIDPDSPYPGLHQEDVGSGYFYIKDPDSHNILRPETVESLYILWKVTGNPEYKEKAWQIFRSFERWTRVEGLERCLSQKPEFVLEDIMAKISQYAIDSIANSVRKGAGWDTVREEVEHVVDHVLSMTRLDDSLPQATSVKENVDYVAGHIVETIIHALDSGTFEVGKRQQKSSEHSKREAQCPHIGPSGGYAGLKSVKEVPPTRLNKMESFWVSETLKYLYLIFVEPPDRCRHPGCNSDAPAKTARFPLDKFVFNTEAHLLPILGPWVNNSGNLRAIFDEASLRPYDKEAIPAEERKKEDDEGQDANSMALEGEDNSTDLTQEARLKEDTPEGIAEVYEDPKQVAVESEQPLGLSVHTEL